VDVTRTMTGPRGRRGALTLAVALVGLFSWQFPLSVDDPARTAAVVTGVWALCFFALSRADAVGSYRPNAMYMLVFGLFHVGFLIATAVRGTDVLHNVDSGWFYRGYTPQALHLVILGMVAFTLGAQLMSWRTGPLSPIVATNVDDPDADRYRQKLATVGLLVEGVSLLMFYKEIAQNHGAGLLSGGYEQFSANLQSSGNSNGYSTLGIGVGAIFALVAGGRARTGGWLLFLGYAIPAIPMGNRGEVLFPLIPMLIVEAQHGRKIRKLWTTTGVLFSLVVIGIVRTGRTTGYSMPTGKQILTSPMDAIAEMGYSLRPTVEVLGWTSHGEGYRHGATLTAVPVRLIEKLTGWHGGPPVQDDRLFNVEIAHRVGPIGGSPVGEGYYNFGILGVLLMMGAIGLFVGWLNQRPLRMLDARVALLVPMMGNVRNSFAQVPAQLVVIAALLVVVRVWSKRGQSEIPVAKGVRHAPVRHVAVRGHAWS
jgi:hypothetical protein